MIKQLACSIAAIAAVASSSLAQQVVIPGHTAVYNGFSRGYSLIANVDFDIDKIELPVDAYLAGDTASFTIEVNGTPMFYDIGGTSAFLPVNPPVQVLTGDVVLVVGNWSPLVTSNFSAHNSYAGGAGPYATTILGVAHQLDRGGYQCDIGDPTTYNGGTLAGGAASFTGLAGSLGRVWIDAVAPGSGGNGIFAGMQATGTNGATPLTVNFADNSFTSDPNGIFLWEWDFDNDGTIDSNLQNPSHTYTVCGVYDVTLTVTDAINGSDSITNVGFVDTDQVVASFTVSALAPQVWQFNDTSMPPATSWAWDFDNDGLIDDTSQNPVYVAATNSSCLSLPDCSFTASLACNSNTLVGPVFAAGASFIGESGGGNGTSSATAVGNYFDIEVTNPEGINVCGVGATPYSFTGPFDMNVYITDGTHLGKEGVPTAWALAGSGSGTSVGAAFGSPVICGVGMNQSFYLPAGNYGVAVFLTIPGGGTVNIAYTNGPATAPYVGADMTIHPAGVGSSSTSELGPVSFTPRLFNGGFYYEVCSVAQNAASGVYGIGCPGSAGVVAGINASSMPTLGGTYSLDVTDIPAPGIAIMMVGVSNTAWNGLPLPFDLSIIGATGCNLLQSANVTSTIVATGNTANWAFSVPNQPALVCATIYNQAAVFDLTANGLGFSFSNARAGVVGN
jgi:PKD repeat protein